MDLSIFGNGPMLAFGRAGMDLYADPPGAETEHAVQFTAALGGSAANIAVGIARLGGKAALATSVSDDAVGRFVINQLVGYGVDTQFVKTISGEVRTSLAVVETRAINCQSVIYRNNAADFQMSVEDIEALDFSQFSACIITGTTLAAEPSRQAHFKAVHAARTAQIPVILDVDYRPYSWTSAAKAADTYRSACALCDIVIGNDDEFAVMAGEHGPALAQHLAATTAQVVIYKMGAKGSVTYAGGETFETGIFPVQALKPTGAGDAFMAGVLMSLQEKRSLREAVQRGSAAAAIVVTKVGCAPASPTSGELAEFMARYGQG